MASTGFNGTETAIEIRHRPSAPTRAHRPIQEAFGDEPELLVEIPQFAAKYNNFMNAVDRGDQLRSYNSWSHRARRGGWNALAWGYLLEVIIVNTFLLQLRGHPDKSKRISSYKK